ncbi:MAG: hypothetical protein ACJ736_16590 [Streptomyces sp.]|jgi:hypothetical protein
MSSNPLADVFGEDGPTDEQLRRIVALLGLRQLPDEASQERQEAA